MSTAQIGLFPAVIEHSIGTGQQLAHYYFQKLIPYFQHIMSNKKLLPDLAIVIAVEWLKGKKGSKKLLDQVLLKNNKAQAKMIDVGLTNIKNKTGKANPKSIYLYKMNLNNPKTEIMESYETSFLHLDPNDFSLLLPILRDYTTSKVAKLRVHYFYDYILKCINDYPSECLELMSNLNHRIKETDFLERGSSKKVSVIIEIYNRLLETHAENDLLIDNALHVFDLMLQDDSYRQNAHEVIKEHDL